MTSLRRLTRNPLHEAPPVSARYVLHTMARCVFLDMAPVADKGHPAPRGDGCPLSATGAISRKTQRAIVCSTYRAETGGASWSGFRVNRRSDVIKRSEAVRDRG